MGKKKNKGKNTPTIQVDDSGQLHFATDEIDARIEIDNAKRQKDADQQELDKIQKELKTTQESQKYYQEQAKMWRESGQDEWADNNEKNYNTGIETISRLEKEEKEAKKKLDKSQKQYDFAASAIRMDGSFNPEGQKIYLEAEQAEKDFNTSFERKQSKTHVMATNHNELKKFQEQEKDLQNQYDRAKADGDEEFAESLKQQLDMKHEEVEEKQKDYDKAHKEWEEAHAEYYRQMDLNHEAQKKKRLAARSGSKKPEEDRSSLSKGKEDKKDRPNDTLIY